MAKITTITNPLTGQPAQVDQLEHTAQQIDDAIARALPGGAIDITLQNKLGGIESTEYPGCYYRMVSGVVEWVNPPMQLGGRDADGNPINEYRTTERYNGKPVYAKLVDCGAGPNATRKTVSAGISNVDRAVTANGSWGAMSIPYEWFSGDPSGAQAITVVLNGGNIEIASTVNYSARTIYALIKYTKTTD